jgi:trehalose 6-phosphate phosphatase
MDDVIAQVRADLPHTLIAVDFDGTLAPIVPNPDDSRPLPGAMAALHQLAERGAQIAVITGRDARTVLRLGNFTDLPGLVIEGLYGAEQWRDGELDSPTAPPELDQLRTELPILLREHHADPAVWIEDKRLSLVVHARRASDPQAALRAVRRPVEQLADRLHLEAHPGRGVLELRLAGYDKGSALERLVDRFGPASVLYLGDDLGDLPAFLTIAQLRRRALSAWAIAVGSAEVPQLGAAADLELDGPDAVVEFLAALAST